MLKKRLNERVEVDLPVICVLEPDQIKGQTAPGRISDLSISGMKFSLALPFRALRSKLIDFILDLPAPFGTIKGHGEIQWKRWDANKRCTSCGIKLSPLSLKHLETLDAIVEEVKSDAVKTR